MRPGAPVMHPGPMNEGVEIDAAVAHGARSLIEKQVTNGVAVRMALLYLLTGAPLEAGDDRRSARAGGEGPPGPRDSSTFTRTCASPGSRIRRRSRRGAHAALRGGFTTICAMPNTEPAIDSPGLVVESLPWRAADGARVLPIAAITRGRRGSSSPISSSSPRRVRSPSPTTARRFRWPSVPKRSRIRARRGRPVIEHPQDLLSVGEGRHARGRGVGRLGLPGCPARRKRQRVARDRASRRTEVDPVHLTHLSTAGSIELVRGAKARGRRSHAT